MINLICFTGGLVLGFIIAIVIVSKPIQFVIHHKNENIIPVIPDSDIPKLSDVDKKVDPEEDKTYEEMGKIMDNVTEIFGGSDRV